MAAADPATLKIRRVEPYILRIGSRRDIVCTRIETVEGIHGWGEGTTPPNVLPVVAQIRSFEKLLAGQSAWDIEKPSLKTSVRLVPEKTVWVALRAAHNCSMA